MSRSAQILSIVVCTVATLLSIIGIACLIGFILEPPLEVCISPFPSCCIGDLAVDSSEGFSLCIQEIAEVQNKLIKDAYESDVGESGESHIELKYVVDTTYTEMRPRARLVGKPFDLSDGRENFYQNATELAPFKLWYEDRELFRHGGFKQYGIQIRNGRIVVPVGGLYIVYSMFVFAVPCKPETVELDTRSVEHPLKHAIFKFDIFEGREVEIVSGVQSHLKSKSKSFQWHSSFISTVVELKAGDELSVKTSNNSLLLHPTENYFGVTIL